MTGDRALSRLRMSEVSVRQLRPAVTEITVHGELDIRTAPRLNEVLEDCFDDERVEIVSLHLGGVTFIDSTGLRSLIRARRSAKWTERVLVLTSPSQSVVRLLEITGMDALFDIVDDY